MKAWGALLLFAPLACAQNFTQRGFLETQTFLYPQTAPGDSGRAVAESLLRYEASYKFSSHFRLQGGVDARADTHRQVERSWGLAWQDRNIRRPALAVRRLSAVFSSGGLTFELGKQFIRWGRADVLTPTDRFAPRDFLAVVDNDFLAVTAARLSYERKTNTLDLVFSPRFTPSRLPLLNQRWVVLPEQVPMTPLRDLGADLPGGPQFGARWNHAGSTLEYSFAFYEGFNHLPLLDVAQASACAAQTEVCATTTFQRFYPQMRMVGGDFALPLRWVTVKGEAAYFSSRTPQADEYVLYVLQLERMVREWFFVAGYAGELLTAARNAFGFNPDRGLAKAVLGRAGYTIDANRSIAFEGAGRTNGDGAWAKIEYSQAFGQHWRATAAFTLIRGAPGDFLGQYRRNSHAALTLRYSF